MKESPATNNNNNKNYTYNTDNDYKYRLVYIISQVRQLTVTDQRFVYVKNHKRTTLIIAMAHNITKKRLPM